MIYRKMSAGVLRVLSRIREHDRARKNNTQNPAPWTRLLAALTAILLSALSRNAFFVLTILAEELLRLALLPAEAVRRAVVSVKYIPLYLNDARIVHRFILTFLSCSPETGKGTG